MNDQLQPSTLRFIRYAILGLSLLLLLCCGLGGYQCSKDAKQTLEENDKRYLERAQIKEGFQRELDAASVAIEPAGKLRGTVFNFRDDTRGMVTEPGDPTIPEASQRLYASSPYDGQFSIGKIIPDAILADPIESADYLIAPKWTTNRKVTISVYDRKRKCIIAAHEFTAKLETLTSRNRRTGVVSSHQKWVMPEAEIESWLRPML